MKTFLSYYMDAGGRRRLRFEKAENRMQCCCIFSQQGIVPVGVWALPFSDFGQGKKFPVRLLAMLFTQLAMALNSGVPLLDALYFMEKEQHNERLRGLLTRLEQNVLAGAALSRALRAESGLPPMVCEWLAIGEKQGRLAQVLEDVAAHLEAQEKMKKQLQQQLLYPMVVLAAIILVGLFLTLVVMPMMVSRFMAVEAQAASGLMQVLLSVHGFLRHYGPGMLLGVGLLGCCFYLKERKRYGIRVGRALGRRLALRVPFLKKLFVLRVYVPFARFLGQMLQSGIPTDDAIEAIRAYFETSIFAEDVVQIASAIGTGRRPSMVISEAVFVPDLAKQMLQNGERYGRLAETLLQSADYYESTLLEEIKLMIRFVEPLAVALLGVLVLLLALGLFLPVMDAYQMILAQ